MIITRFEELYSKGQYQQILDELTLLEEKGELVILPLADQVEIIYYKSKAMYRLGQFEESLQVVTQAQAEIIPAERKHLVIPLLVSRLGTLWRLGRLDEALETIKEGDGIIESMTVKDRETKAKWVAYFNNNKGIIYHAKGELDKALECYQRDLTSRETTGNPRDLFPPLCNIGEIYIDKGEFNKAFEYFQRALTLSESMDYTFGIGYSLHFIGVIYLEKGEYVTALNHLQRSLALQENLSDLGNIAETLENIGAVYHVIGELDKALDYYQRGLALFERIGNSHFIAWSLLNIGSIYHDKGELKAALDNYKRCLPLYERIGNDINISAAIFSLVLVSLDQQDQDQAQMYLKQLLALNDRTPVKILSFRSRLASALILKQSKRLKDKIQAQTILEEIIEEESIHFQFKALAMIHLCELLLMELKSLGEPEVLAEAKALVSKLQALAQERSSFSLAVEALLLRAKFAIIEGNLQQALQYLDQAKMTAEEKNLGLLAENIRNEQELLRNEYDKWQKLIQRNAPIQERLEKARMENYIREASKAVRLLKISN